MEERVFNAYKSFVKHRMYGKALDVLEAAYKTDKTVYRMLKNYRAALTTLAKSGEKDKLPEYMALLRRAYLVSAYDCFDDFCTFMEWDRPMQHRFYPIRRKALLPVVNRLQALEDDKLDLLSISMPPGTGKTGLASFFMAWVGGRKPQEGIIMGSHNASFLRGMYEEMLRLLDPDGEYNWGEVFPGKGVVRTNALDMKIDVERAQRFSTFQFASIGGGNAGKLRAVSYLICDDLIEGIEEALSRDRLEKKWVQYNTDLRQRKQGNCKEVHIATRWSVNDVIGKLQREYIADPKSCFFAVPALDKNDKSNFDYGGSSGFTAAFFIKQREIMDDATFRALYQNEPIERTGVLYNTDELRRFLDLPSGDPDAVWSVCDTKDRGEDYYVMPIAYQYGEDYYIVDIICDNRTPEAVMYRVCDKLTKYKVKQCRFESNAAGGQIASRVKEKLRQGGNKVTNISTKYSTANKETRILVDSSFVKEHFLFLDPQKYDREYRTAMNFLTSYSMIGKNKHDDVPDAMSMLADFVQNYKTVKAKVMKRPW